MATGAFMFFLRREGWGINLKKTHRIYNELGLQLRNKTPKRRVKAKLRDDRRAASTSNEVWGMGCGSTGSACQFGAKGVDRICELRSGA